MTLSSKEFATQQTRTTTVGTTTTTPTSERTATTKHHCDILLNNFQIKKKQYRVLFNNDHIVWERLDANRTKIGTSEKLTKKELEIETEQLSHRAATAVTYGRSSNVVHINEIIRVAKGNTKSATFRQNTQPKDSNATLGVTQEQQRQQQQQQTIAATTPPTEQYMTIHYAERINKSPIDCNRWHIRTLTLYNSDAYIVRQWHALINSILEQSARLRVQRLLVFINPYGGRKQGLQMYERYCKPVFELAGIDASCIISQRANQIRDILMSHDLCMFDAVCCVGGDGTVAEVINGLIFRAMRDLHMDLMQPAYIPKPTLPVGIIPAGSTDTVAYSLHGTSDVRTAAIHVILGQRRGLDICSVRNRQGIVRFCASAFSYGYLGDVAAKSEKYRWMGTKRYEFTGVKSFLLNRGYEAEIRMLLANEDTTASTLNASLQTVSTTEATTTAESICYVNCQRCSTASTLQQNNMQQSATSITDQAMDDMPTSSNISLYAQFSNDGDTHIAQDIQNLDEEIENMKNFSKNNLLESHLQKHNQIEELLKTTEFNDVPLNADEVDRRKQQVLEVTSTENTATVCQKSVTLSEISFNNSSSANASKSDTTSSTENWKIVKGRFFMITGANITCACTRSPNGIARYSHLGDGTLDLVLVRKTSLWSNLRLILNTMGRNGDVRNLPFVEVYRTKKFSFRTPNVIMADDEYSINGSCQPITLSAGTDENANVSNWNCDGEVVSDLDVTMSSHCQLIDVFMRGPYSYTKADKATDKEQRNKICCCFNSI